ncbi:phosphoesterase [Asanoa ishikariensis]|uniref:Polymerase/histidinol phosphatase N-terminal domain-containing protein n=1 Tax=Asanoa ishikariensis TaxID=137265 RepID=A0A1H3TWK9_9ACTN|nr:CehA/McbA family metallohydrolase [Asanoa ishikariensis]GIF67476.1 phosphoesterase [Asanoa ishikariensis]SDZ53629.1 hypothetical protein SAMN05421684_6372 [Asanoa ishikariensis]
MELEPVRFGPDDVTRTVSGTIPYGAPDWVYLPVEIPDGVNRITVVYRYDRPTPPPGHDGNALDLGVFDAHAGFRGWSGGARDGFTISASDATPGYLPGPVHAGRWHVLLGPYGIVPDGLPWTVTVTLERGPDGPTFVPNPAPHEAAGRGRAWYRGDMHLHTVHSDGRREPAELAADARAAGLDYIVSTEHNTPSAHAVWGAYAGPDLLIINGTEVTTRNGHYAVLGLPAGTWIDWRYRATDGAVSAFVNAAHKVGALAVANHPLASCKGCGWKFGYEGLDAIEVWNGPWTPDDEATLGNWDNQLVSGERWLPAVGNSDVHGTDQIVGLPQNVVLADRLDRDSIVAGVRAGHLWIAESAAVDLDFTASAAGLATAAGLASADSADSAADGRSAGIGERLDVAEDTAITVMLTVRGVPGGVVRIVTDQGRRLVTPVPATGVVSWTTTPRASRYVRAEVRRGDTMVALTNPIFLGRR